MKVFLGIVSILLFSRLFSQNEAANWVLAPNSLLNFATSPPGLTYNPSFPFYSWESSAAISDDNGNLLFYASADTVRDADGSVLPNGEDLSFVPALFMQSTTQGFMFIPKPGNSDLYYLFSLGFYADEYSRGLFSYSVIDRTLNSGLGAVTSASNFICADTLAEKLTATKHCNNKDYWIVIVKGLAITTDDGDPVDWLTEFRSYLLTENGLQLSPIKSVFHTECGRYGQMKFNPAGDEIAFAREGFLTRLSFDRSTGKVSMKEEVSLPVLSGYGIEYSSSGDLLYINQVQYNLATGIFTQLLPQTFATQLQRGIDDKIYGIRVYDNFTGTAHGTSWTDYNTGNSPFGNFDQNLNIDAITQPNNPGTACQYISDYVVGTNPEYQNYQSLALPNFPAFYLNHAASEFTYSGTCAGEEFTFSLIDSSTADSVKWIFSENGVIIESITANHSYSQPGEYEVTLIVYSNGIPSTSTQCVIVCGENAVSLPQTVNLCEVAPPFELNALNTCSASYLWSTGDTTAAISVSKPGIYTLTTSNSCGTYNYSVSVTENDCGILSEIPNVITLNNDQINDVFSVKVKNVKSIQFTIINRWGNVMERGTYDIPPPNYLDWNSAPLWNGYSDSIKSTNGVYFYVIEFTSLTGEVDSRTGFLEVLD